MYKIQLILFFRIELCSSNDGGKEYYSQGLATQGHFRQCNQDAHVLSSCAAISQGIRIKR